MTRRQAIFAALAALLSKPTLDSFHARNMVSSLWDVPVIRAEPLPPETSEAINAWLKSQGYTIAGATKNDASQKHPRTLR
jgi:hypothetical protein